MQEKIKMDNTLMAQNLDKFLAEVEWFSKLGLTSRGLRLLLNVYLNEGKRVSDYNRMVNEGETEERLASLVGKTSGYFSNFERLGLVTKVPDETDVRGQAKKIYLTYKVKEALNKLLPILCEESENKLS